MRIIARKSVIAFWTKHPDAESALRAWFTEVKNCDWEKPSQIKIKYHTASILGNGRCVFNVCGNKYRLIVKVNYAYKIVYIRFVGTHNQYDRIDASTV